MGGGDQAAIAVALGVVERGRIGEVGRRIVVALQHRGVALERVDVIDVDPQDVIERGAQGREEAGARRGEFALRQRLAGAEQPVVGPRIVAGHGDEVAGQPPPQERGAQAACARLRST